MPFFFGFITGIAFTIIILWCIGSSQGGVAGIEDDEDGQRNEKEER